MIDHNVIENEANSVTFTCEAIGEPSPTISWYFNDVMIITSDKYNISDGRIPGRVESSLTINNPETSNAGTYTCRAENVVGSDNSSGILTVNGKVPKTNSNYNYITRYDNSWVPHTQTTVRHAFHHHTKAVHINCLLREILVLRVTQDPFVVASF